MHRRTFIGAIFSGLSVSAFGARPPKLKAGDLPAQNLGKTGERLTRSGMGGARFHLIPFEEGKARKGSNNRLLEKVGKENRLCAILSHQKASVRV